MEKYQVLLKLAESLEISKKKKKKKQEQEENDLVDDLEEALAKSHHEQSSKLSTPPVEIDEHGHNSTAHEKQLADPELDTHKHVLHNYTDFLHAFTPSAVATFTANQMIRKLVDKKVEQKIKNKFSKTSALNKIDALAEDYRRTKSKLIFEQLERELEPMIKSVLAQYSNSGVPEDLLYNQILLILKQSLETYKPDQAGFTTWFKQNLQQIYRFVNNLQGALTLPEEYKRNYGVFETAYNNLYSQLGRRPSFDELKKQTKLPDRMLNTFLTRNTMPLEEDTWAKYTDNFSYKVKEALAHVEAKYGPMYARAIEEVEVGDKSLAAFCRENNLDYGRFYYKFQEARNEFKTMVL